jgi:hypothetical protein
MQRVLEGGRPKRHHVVRYRVSRENVIALGTEACRLMLVCAFDSDYFWSAGPDARCSWLLKLKWSICHCRSRHDAVMSRTILSVPTCAVHALRQIVI